MGFDKKYLASALIYAAVGMGLGVFMAGSHNHGQLVTHAHTLLVGFVVSLIYAVIHKLWLSGVSARVATVQFVVHQLGALVMGIGLFLLYGGFVPSERIDPVLAAASIGVLVAVLMMLFMVLRSTPPESAAPSASTARTNA